MATLPVHHPLDRERRQRQDRAGASEASTVRPTIHDLVADTILDAAYDWLCRRRRDYPDAADVWTLRRTWPTVKATLRADLLAGRYRLGLLHRVVNRAGDRLDLWAARDAVVLKALALVLGRRLPRSRRCTHLKGHGGSAGARRGVRRALPAHRFVLRTDVREYYASIDHDRVLDRLGEYVRDPRVLRLVGQYLRRCSERGGLFWEARSGLPRGSSLSPVLGAFFLAELDAALTRHGVWFVRYMDDILVLTATRWVLRRMVRLVHDTLRGLGLEIQPTKTFIGRIDKGFDFLGFRFSPHGVTVAPATWERFVEHTRRLYEQDRRAPPGSPRLEAYVRRWRGWARPGLHGQAPA